MPLRIDPFDKATHDRGTFDCGTAALNDYLKKQATQHLKRGVCKVYVLVDDRRVERVLGYYTLSSSQLARSDLAEHAARRLPRHPVPTITLGRMAVRQEEQGCGHGALLLIDALQRCARVSQEVGVYAIIVDAKDEKAKAFYEHYGFQELPEHPKRLLLPMGTAAQLLES